MSTDRICQLSGPVKNVTNCLDKILADLKTTPLEGNVIQYDANMYNEREEYGGFKSWHIENATGKTWRGSSNRNGGYDGDRSRGGAYGDNQGSGGYNRYNGQGDGPGFGSYGDNNNNGYNDRNNGYRNGNNSFNADGGDRPYNNFNNRRGPMDNNGYNGGRSGGPGNFGGQGDMGGFSRANYDDPNEEDKVVCRMLIPTRLAGALIGKRGETVNRMRMDFSCEISIPTSTTSERTLRVMSTEHKNVVNCIKSMLEEIGEELKRSGRILEDEHTEVRLLMHTSHAGYVIGQGGKNIKTLRNDTGCRIIINTEHCPYSTDRVCQISGLVDSVMTCVDRILVMVDETPIKGEKKRYNANFANDKVDYGGYKSGPRRSDRRYGSGDNRDNFRDGDNSRDYNNGNRGPQNNGGGDSLNGGRSGYTPNNNNTNGSSYGGSYMPNTPHSNSRSNDDDRSNNRYNNKNGGNRNDRYNQEPRGGYNNTWNNEENANYRSQNSNNGLGGGSNNNNNNTRYGNSNSGSQNQNSLPYNTTNTGYTPSNNQGFKSNAPPTGYKPNNNALAGTIPVGNPTTNGAQLHDNSSNGYGGKPRSAGDKFLGGREGSGVKKEND